MENRALIFCSCFALLIIGNLVYTAFNKVKLMRKGNKSFSFDVDGVSVSIEDEENSQS